MGTVTHTCRHFRVGTVTHTHRQKEERQKEVKASLCYRVSLMPTRAI